MSFEKYARKCIHFVSHIHSSMHPRIPSELVGFIDEQARRYKSIVVDELKIVETVQLQPLYPKGKLLMDLFIALATDDMLDNVIDDKHIETFKGVLRNQSTFMNWYTSNSHHFHYLSIDEYEGLGSDSVNEVLKSVNMTDPTLLNLLYNNNFVSVDIHHTPETTPIHRTRFAASKLELTLYHLEELNTGLSERLHKIVQYMDSYRRHRVNIIKVSLFLGERRKELKHPEMATMTPFHINSGSSIAGKVVYGWRSEELTKVLIHELIHLMRYDIPYSNSEYQQLQRKTARRYNIDGMVRPNEAFTDSLAILLHTAFIHAETGLDIKYLLRLEMLHMAVQVAKAIDFLDMRNYEELVSGGKTIRQGTSFFSYYLIKAFLFWEAGGRLIEILKMKSVTLFGREINRLRDAGKLRVVVDKIIDMLPDMDGYIRNNFRMSCLQLE